MHRKHLNISKQTSNLAAQGRAYTNLGNAYQSLGDFNRAIKMHEKHLVLTQETTDLVGQGSAYSHLGLAYHSLGAFERAIEMHQKHLAIALKTSDLAAEGTAYGNLGSVYQALGGFNRAIEMHEKHLAITRQTGDVVGQGKAHGNLGNAHQAVGDFETAIHMHEEDLAIARQTGDLAGQQVAYHNLAHCHFYNGDLKQAHQMLVKATGILKRMRQDLGSHDEWKRPWLEQYQSTYETLVHVLMMLDRTDQALAAADGCKAQTLLDLLLASGNLSQPTTALSAHDIRDEVMLYGYTMVEYFLCQHHDFNEYDKSWGVIEAMYIWVVSPEHGVQFVTVDADPLRNITQQNSEGLAQTTSSPLRKFQRKEPENTAPSSLTECLKEWHKVLIKPIQQWLPTNPDEVVVIVPHKELFLVPFAGLLDGQGRALIDRHSIVVAPSIKVMHDVRQRASTGMECGGCLKEMLIVGNPDGSLPGIHTSPSMLPPRLLLRSILPGAEKEAQIVAQMVDGKAMIGKEGSKEQILRLAPSADVIHIASHCTSTETPPRSWLFGAICLGSDECIDSVDVLKLPKLVARLVVLSACVTGLGKCVVFEIAVCFVMLKGVHRMTGDGVMGLTRSFLAKGCWMVMATLNRVDDDITTEFMRKFYDRVFGCCPRPERFKCESVIRAFTETIREHKKEHPDPKHWAAFVLYD